MGLSREPGAGGRPEPRDAHVGRKAVELGLITASQLADVLLQMSGQPAQPKKPSTLSAALVSGGLLTQRQIDILVDSKAAPTQVGKYRILRELGRGGMGVVYEAEDVELHRPVALKMLLGSLHADSQETALEEERFIRESRLSANLSKHPHLVGIYEAGSVDGRRFIAMEYVEGLQFSDWRRGGSITIRQQITVLRDVAMAVEHAHSHGVIHRDLKPQNILVDSKNQPHVTDFGLAKRASRQATLSLTASGLVMGTPAYMSPEQAEGKKDVDRRADVWSLGVMLFEILTGRLPFNGQTPLEILMKTVNEPVPLPSSFFKAGVPASLDRMIEDICLKALAKDPKDRYPGAKGLADDLTRWLKGQKVTVVTRRRKIPRSWIIGGAVGAVALAAAIAFGVLPDSASDRAARAEDYVLEGRRHLQNRRYSDAIIAFGKAIEQDPDSRAAKAGKKDAEEKLMAQGRPTPQPPSRPDDDAARKARERAAEQLKRELGELDSTTRSLSNTESFGSARDFLQQAFPRHEEADWKSSVASRQSDLQKSVAAVLGPLKEEAAQAKRRGDTASVDSLRDRVDRWKWPAALVELDDSLAKIALPEPPRPAAGPAKPLKAHTTGVHVLAFLPDGKTVLTGSFDNTVRLWDVEKRTERRKLSDKVMPVSAAASPDGRWMAVGYKDASLLVWDTSTLEARSFKGHSSQVTGIAFTPDGNWMASSSTDGVARIWDVASGTSKFDTEGFPNGAMSLALSLDGKTLAVGSADRLIRVFDMPSGRERSQLADVHEAEVYTVAVSPDGKQVLTGGKDRTSVLIDLPSGRRKTLLKVETAVHQIRQVKFTPDGRWAVVSSTDGTISFFDAATGTPVRTVKQPAGFFSVVFTRKGDVMAAGTTEGTVEFWDMKSLGLPKDMDEVAKVPPPPVPAAGNGEPLQAHLNGVHVLALLPDGKSLLTGSFDNTVRLWDLEKRTERRKLSDKVMPVSSAASADGRWMAVGFIDTSLRVWDTSSYQVRSFTGHEAQVTGIAFTPDGKWLGSSSTDGSVRIWDTATGTSKFEAQGFPRGAMCLGLSLDGKTMAAGSAGRLIRVFDMPTGKERKLFEDAHESAIFAIAVSPDGRQVLSGGQDKTAVLIDLASGRRKTLLKANFDSSHQFRQATFSPDGRWAVVASTDGTMSFFDTTTGAPVRTMSNSARFFSAQFNRKGDVLVTGTAEGTVLFWDVKSLGLPK